MARWRRAIELAMTEEEIDRLRTVTRSRTEPARRVERARMLLTYGETQSYYAVGRSLGMHHQTVERCVERALANGPLAALDDRPHPGKEPTITPEARAWLTSLACDKAKEHGYRTNCGRRGSWRVMRASMDRRRGTRVLPSWSKARCARYSAKRKSSRIRCATILKTAMPSSNVRWRKFCASIAKSQF